MQGQIFKDKIGHLTTPHDIVERYLFDSNNTEFNNNVCDECSPTKTLMLKHIPVKASSISFISVNCEKSKMKKMVKYSTHTAQKLKFSIKDVFSKCDQIAGNSGFGHIYWGNPYFKNFIFCAVSGIFLLAMERNGSGAEETHSSEMCVGRWIYKRRLSKHIFLSRFSLN